MHFPSDWLLCNQDILPDSPRNEPNAWKAWRVWCRGREGVFFPLFFFPSEAHSAMFPAKTQTQFYPGSFDACAAACSNSNSNNSGSCKSGVAVSFNLSGRQRPCWFSPAKIDSFSLPLRRLPLCDTAVEGKGRSNISIACPAQLFFFLFLFFLLFSRRDQRCVSG